MYYTFGIIEVSGWNWGMWTCTGSKCLEWSKNLYEKDGLRDGEREREKKTGRRREREMVREKGR